MLPISGITAGILCLVWCRRAVVPTPAGHLQLLVSHISKTATRIGGRLTFGLGVRRLPRSSLSNVFPTNARNVTSLQVASTSSCASPSKSTRDNLADQQDILKRLAVSPSQHLHFLDQCDILDRLAEGEGIAAHEWDGVVEKCFMCNKTMLGAVLQAHSRDCWHVSDDESEVDKLGMQ